MIDNKTFSDKDNKKRFHFLDCDSCNKENMIMFDSLHTRFSSSKCDPHIVYIHDGIYCMCSEECLKLFIEKNINRFFADIRRKIPQDQYFYDKLKEDTKDEMELDVSYIDGDDGK
jgi:hypothetical protein